MIAFLALLSLGPVILCAVLHSRNERLQDELDAIRRLDHGKYGYTSTGERWRR